MLRPPIILLINFFNFLRFLWRTFWHTVVRVLTRKQKHYVILDLKNDYVFGASRKSFASLFRDEPGFLDIRATLKKIECDDNIDGIVVLADNINMGAARLAEFQDLFDAMRARGKTVVTHLQMATMKDYLLASASNDILMPPSGRMYVFGLRIDQRFFAEALQKAGAVAQFVHIGPYKTASHRFIHRTMTPAQKIMMTHLFNAMQRRFFQVLSSRRQMDQEQITSSFSRMPMESRDAMRLGLIDGEVFRHSLTDWLAYHNQLTHLAKEPLQHSEILTTEFAHYTRTAPARYQWKPLFRAHRQFAVMDLTGMIIMPDMHVPGQSAASIDPKEVIPKLKQIRKNPRIAGLLLHINSPGGSALASDLIWHAIKEVQSTKPVVAYCSDVAASGGYYLATAADKILCRPESITGSIGVIAGKISFPSTLERFGVNSESIYDSDTATFTSLTHPMAHSVMDNLRNDGRAFYRRFLQRVGQARGLSKRRLHRYARGRVYTGNEALQRQLVDQLGGFEDSLQELANLCQRSVDDTALHFVVHRKQSIKAALRRNIAGNYTQVVEQLLEPATITTMLQREAVLALWPYQINS